MRKRSRWFLVAAVLGLAGWGLGIQVGYRHRPPESASGYTTVLEDPARDDWQDPEGVMAKLDLRPGDDVADLGAGSGYFTIRFAHLVGPAGRVYAIDVDPEMVKHIEEHAREEELENVQTILADPGDPKLGSASMDLIFICNVLHHIENRERYYPLLARALKPGGRIVNIDYHKRKLPVGPAVEMKIAKKDVIREFEAAGFRLAEDYDFLKYQYFLVFER